MIKRLTITLVFLVGALSAGYLGAFLFSVFEPKEYPRVDYRIIITDEVTENETDEYLGPLLDLKEFY